MLKLTAVLAFTIVDTGMAVYNKHMYWDNNTVGYTTHSEPIYTDVYQLYWSIQHMHYYRWGTRHTSRVLWPGSLLVSLHWRTGHDDDDDDNVDNVDDNHHIS